MVGLEAVTLRKRQETELEVAEKKLLKFSLGVTRGTTHVRDFRDEVKEAKLRWFGHVQRRGSEFIGRRMLSFQLPGRRPKGRPKRRFIDEDMKVVV